MVMLAVYDQNLVDALWEFWNKWNNDTNILDGSDIHGGKYSLIDNGDLADLEVLGNRIDELTSKAR